MLVAGAAAATQLADRGQDEAPQVDPQKAAESAARVQYQNERLAAGTLATTQALGKLKAVVAEVEAANPAGPTKPLDPAARAKLVAALADATGVARVSHLNASKALHLQLHELMADQYFRVTDYPVAHFYYASARGASAQIGGDQSPEYSALLKKDIEACRQARDLDGLPELRLQVHRIDVSLRGADHPITAASELAYAASLGQSRDPSKIRVALEKLPQIVKRRQATYGATHPEALTALNSLCDAYVRADPKASIDTQLEYVELSRDQFAANDPVAIGGVIRLGDTYTGQFQKANAARQYRRAAAQSKLAFGPDDERTLGCMEKAAESLLAGDLLGHPARFANGWEKLEAVTLLEHVLATRTRNYGPADPRTRQSLDRMANGYSNGGRPDDAVRIEKLKLQRSASARGDDSPGTWRDALDTAEKLRYAKRYDEAIALLEKSVGVVRKSENQERLQILKRMLEGLRELYLYQSRPADAVSTQKELLDLVTGERDPRSRELVRELDTLAKAYQSARRTDDVIATYRRVEAVLQARDVKLPDDAAEVKGLLYQNKANLVRVYYHAKRTDDAVALAEECYPTFSVADRRKLPNSYYWSQMPGHVLKQHYERTKKYAELVKLLQDDIDYILCGNDPDRAQAAASVQRKLIAVLAGAGRHAEAIESGLQLEAASTRPQYGAGQREALDALRCEVAASCTAAGRPADAAKLYERVLESEFGFWQSYKQEYVRVALLRNQSLLAAGDAAGAIEALAVVAAKYPARPEHAPSNGAEVLYNLARSVALHSADPKHTSQEAEALRARAMAQLQVAVRSGFKDAARAKADLAWKPFLEQDDFTAALRPPAKTR